MRFRLIGGVYRVKISGSGSTSASSAAGTVTLDGSGFSDQPGRFSVNGGPFQAMPASQAKYTLGPLPAAPLPEVSARGIQTVLVVEDESSIASFVALYLKNAGYAVKTAATGTEALDRRSPPPSRR